MPPKKIYSSIISNFQMFCKSFSAKRKFEKQSDFCDLITYKVQKLCYNILTKGKGDLL